MTVYERLRGEVTALEAARAYGLRFGRGGRAFCPWHEDGRSPALAFYGERCYCHACHHGGDAVALAGQIFGLSAMEAARRVAEDFGISVTPETARERKDRREKIRRRTQAHREENRRWSALCAVRRAADRALERFGPEDADDPRLWRLVKTRALCDQELDGMTPEPVCGGRK